MIGGSSPGRGFEFFSSPRPDRLCDPHSPLSNGYQGLIFLEVKRPGREADHPPPSSAEIKNAWTCTSTPHTIVTFRQFVNIFYHENVIIICPISMFTAVLEYFTGNVILEDISHISEKHIFCCGVMMKTLLNVLWHYDAEIKKSLLVL
jgi:hypothetical protein